MNTMKKKAGWHGNENHPKKGSIIRVQPIKKTKDISVIKKLLMNKPRDLALFTIGINTNLRASDLIRITTEQVRGLRAGESFPIREKKTKKYREVTLNKACIQVIQKLLASKMFRDNDPLFPITTIRINQLVKQWTQSINLKGNYGSHTLRKTWGRIQHTEFNVPIPVLMVCFNHSTQKQTLQYLCIDDAEIKSVFQNEI